MRVVLLPLCLLALLVVGGCRIFGISAVPCETDAHCAPDTRCLDGVCAAEAVLADDGGTLPDAGVDDGGSVVDDDAGVDDAGEAGPPPDCATLLDENANAETGVHTIFPPNRPTGVQVWCDMDVAGGGWTLAARSSNGGGGSPWGWGAERGAPNDVDQPYVAGVTTFGIQATELLVTEIDSDGDPDRNIYRLVFASDVLVERTTSIARVDFQVVKTTCEGEIDLEQGQPWMLVYAGCTDRSDVLLLRDNPGCDNYGLRPDGFFLNYDNCSQGGDLNGRERGAIFVR